MKKYKNVLQPKQKHLLAVVRGVVRGESPPPPPPTPPPPPPPHMEKQSRSTSSNGSASIVSDKGYESGISNSNGASLDDLPKEGNGSGSFPKARSQSCVVS